MNKVIKYGLLGATALGAVWVGSTAISVQRQMSVEYQNVQLAISQVQNVLNRQAELIPNLAEVAKGYAKHEQDTFAKVAAFRSNAAEIAHKNPGDVANSTDMQQKMAETAVAGQQALFALKAVQERYPQLQANENFKTLMVELEGSINRVSTERRKSQQVIKEYNTKIVQFPTNVVASAIGYKALPFYQAAESDQHAPRLNMTF